MKKFPVGLIQKKDFLDECLTPNQQVVLAFVVGLIVMSVGFWHLFKIDVVTLVTVVVSYALGGMTMAFFLIVAVPAFFQRKE